jgi:3-oxoacyl-[acyl-carrier protein] reductase
LRQVDLSGRVTLVTGASRGIGAAIASAAADAGSALVISARDKGALEDVAAPLRIRGVRILVIAGDISDPKFVAELFKATFLEFRQLDGLVNNAGALADGAVGMFKSEQIDQAIRLNLTAAIECTQLAARLMQRRNVGSIVNLTSIMGTAGAPGQAVYASAKAGLIGLTKASAKELGPKGIRVNAVAPGMIDTNMIAVLDEQQRAERVRRIALGRIGKPEEVADLVTFLLSDRANYITGQTIGIDGGQVI